MVSPTPEATLTLVPTLTPTRPPLPTNTAQPTGFAFQNVGGVGATSEGCSGNYIFGTVRAPDGAPLSGITVLAVDEYGNQLVATSKAEPPGQYDFPISGGNISYRVSIVAGAQALSAPIVVSRGTIPDDGRPLCYTLNWQRIP